MTDEELRYALFGLFAYDVGGTDSGIKDERLKDKVRLVLALGSDIRPFQVYSDRLSRLVREEFLSEGAIVAGYGLEDVAVFLRWLEDEMGIW